MPKNAKQYYCWKSCGKRTKSVGNIPVKPTDVQVSAHKLEVSFNHCHRAGWPIDLWV